MGLLIKICNQFYIIGSIELVDKQLCKDKDSIMKSSVKLFIVLLFIEDIFNTAGEVVHMTTYQKLYTNMQSVHGTRAGYFSSVTFEVRDLICRVLFRSAILLHLMSTPNNHVLQCTIEEECI